MSNFLGLVSTFDSVVSSDKIAEIFVKMWTNWTQK